MAWDYRFKFPKIPCSHCVSSCVKYLSQQNKVIKAVFWCVETVAEVSDPPASSPIITQRLINYKWLAGSLGLLLTASFNLTRIYLCSTMGRSHFQHGHGHLPVASRLHPSSPHLTSSSLLALSPFFKSEQHCFTVYKKNYSMSGNIRWLQHGDGGVSAIAWCYLIANL